MIKNCKLGRNVKIPHPNLVNLYGCEIGNNSFIGPFVEITRGVIIGKDCRIQSHSFICGGVILGNDVFIGHGVTFTNDKFPKVNNKDWKMEKTLVGNNVLIGAGTVVTKDVADNKIIYSKSIKTEVNRG